MCEVDRFVRLKREREMGMVDRRQADVRRASCRIELTKTDHFVQLLAWYSCMACERPTEPFEDPGGVSSVF
jgi:hypothetical protein